MKYKNITIHKRPDSNTWFARWIEHGQKYRISGKRQQDVLELLKQHFKVTKTKQITYTLNSWIDKWLELYKQNNRESTKKMFAQFRNKHMQTSMFRQSISTITTMQLQDTINGMNTPKLKTRMYKYLKDILDKAYKNEITAKDLTLNLIIPKYKASEKRAMTIVEEQSFIEKCQTFDYGYIFLIQLLEGLRPGECLALEWEDIDFKNNEISITKSITNDKFDTQTKNKYSNRIMPLFDNVKDILIQYKNKGRIYPKENNAKRKLFKKILQECNFDYNFTEHELRHTFITRCNEQNVPEHIIQKWVGHEIGSTITKQIYTHINKDAEQKAINKLNKN